MNRGIHKNKYNFKNSTYQSGMTLVELVVVLTIFVIVTGLTIFDYRNFRTNISIQNLANDISLSIRKAQSYAIGARVTGITFNNGYGVHFTSANSAESALSGSNKSFIIFVDGIITGIQDKIYAYNLTDLVCGTANECNEVLSITTTDKIDAIYLNDSVTPIADTSALDISFLRPNPDARFCYRPVAINLYCDNTTSITNAKIQISNGETDTNKRIKTITIWNTGQISVK
jgi:prepilin-type N-terminal cleavage/methylation domain-containing protein